MSQEETDQIRVEANNDSRSTGSRDGMRRREFLKAGAGAAALTLSELLPNAQARAAADERPNIVFVFDDQLRADVVGAYGGPKNISTPNMDQLAAQGRTFYNSISAYPLCTPYRGMLQTGRYPAHSGIFVNWTEVSSVQNPNCLAKVFGQAGYNTAFIGKWHLAAGALKKAGLSTRSQNEVRKYREQNPNTEFVPPGPARLGYHHWEAFNFHVDFNNYWFYRDEPNKIYSGKYETDTEIDQAIAYMERHKNDAQPFLLMVAPHPPHPPFRETHVPGGFLHEVPPAQELKWNPNVPKDSPRRAEEYRYYLAMAKNMDYNLGRLMNYLDESGLAENSILIFTSDHGEMHGSQGRINKMVPYAESVNVPLIMRWPGKIATGTRSAALYTAMDHFPTLCGLVGLEVPPEVDGADLSDVVLGKRREDRDAVLMVNMCSHWDFFQSGTRWPEWRGVRTERYTYVRWLTGEEELYDNLVDPYQMENLIQSQAHFARVQYMRRRLKELLEEANDEFLPGTAYAAWFDQERNLLRTALGPVRS